MFTPWWGSCGCHMKGWKHKECTTSLKILFHLFWLLPAPISESVLWRSPCGVAMLKFTIKATATSKQIGVLCLCCHVEIMSPSPSWFRIFKATQQLSTDYLPAGLLLCSSDQSLPDTSPREQRRRPDCPHLLKHSGKGQFWVVFF